MKHPAALDIAASVPSVPKSSWQAAGTNAYLGCVAMRSMSSLVECAWLSISVGMEQRKHLKYLETLETSQGDVYPLYILMSVHVCCI